MVENWDTVGELERGGNWPWDVCASAPTGTLIRQLWVVWDNWHDDASHTPAYNAKSSELADGPHFSHEAAKRKNRARQILSPHSGENLFAVFIGKKKAVFSLSL